MKPCAVLIAIVTVGMRIRHITLFPEHMRNRIREYAPALVIPGHCELNRGRPRRAWCPSFGLHYVPSLKKAQFAPGTRVYSAHICSLVNTPLTRCLTRDLILSRLDYDPQEIVQQCSKPSRPFLQFSPPDNARYLSQFKIAA
jgi:hypothetical protein